MDVVTALPRSRPLTRDDLDGIPDDGHRYELVDGVLVVTPAPPWQHQEAVGQLFMLLATARPSPDFRVLMAPFDVVLAPDTVLQPDLLVAQRSDLTQRGLHAPPLLAVEVVSPSTRRLDLALKRARYEAGGCPSYWVVDPEEPSLTAWELRRDTYTEAGHVRGDEAFNAALPYPVTVVPTDLLYQG